MRVTVNDEARDVQDGLTVGVLLEQEGEPARHVLVEVNGEFVTPRLYAGRTLADGDRIEIIHPAFGG